MDCHLHTVASGDSVLTIEQLTDREREIMIQVVQGRLNKQIAGEMGITETTVKVHRSNMMRKVSAASVAAAEYW